MIKEEINRGGFLKEPEIEDLRFRHEAQVQRGNVLGKSSSVHSRVSSRSFRLPSNQSNFRFYLARQLVEKKKKIFF